MEEGRCLFEYPAVSKQKNVKQRVTERESKH